MKKPTKLSQCHSILDLRELAQQRLPAPIFHFLDGAAETEATAQRNTAAFDQVQVVPRCLVDVAATITPKRLELSKYQRSQNIPETRSVRR